jgi:hypothetical protein
MWQSLWRSGRLTPGSNEPPLGSASPGRSTTASASIPKASQPRATPFTPGTNPYPGPPPQSHPSPRATPTQDPPELPPPILILSSHLRLGLLIGPPPPGPLTPGPPPKSPPAKGGGGPGRSLSEQRRGRCSGQWPGHLVAGSNEPPESDESNSLALRSHAAENRTL